MRVQSGKCFDVGQDVFSHTNNAQMLNTIGDETQQWASIVVAQLKAGTTRECDDHDHKIAEAGILGY